MTHGYNPTTSFQVLRVHMNASVPSFKLDVKLKEMMQRLLYAGLITQVPPNKVTGGSGFLRVVLRPTLNFKVKMTNLREVKLLWRSICITSTNL